nr:hypothetical protein B0A51_14566 [Rachicladosporium sp. CCFEE 5018]
MAQSNTGLPPDFAANYHDYNARFERFMPADASGGLLHDVHREELAYSPLISTSVKLAVDAGDRTADQEVGVKRQAHADLYKIVASLSVHDSDDSSEEECEPTDDEMDDASGEADSSAPSESQVEAGQAEPVDTKALLSKLMWMGTTRACVWVWNAELKHFLGMPQDNPLGRPAIEPFRNVVDVGAAALAIAWLERCARPHEHTWSGCAMKARSWMGTKRNVNAEYMIRAADAILPPLRDPRDYESVNIDRSAQIGKLLSMQMRKNGLWDRQPGLRDFLGLPHWKITVTGAGKKNQHVMPTALALAWLHLNGAQHASKWKGSITKAEALLQSRSGKKTPLLEAAKSMLRKLHGTAPCAPPVQNFNRGIDVARPHPASVLSTPTSPCASPEPAVQQPTFKRTTELIETTKQSSTATYPQYAMLGYNREKGRTDIQPGETIFLNNNSPCSTFICGSQGSGKSYTLAAMLEGCLLEGNRFGPMQQPLAGVLFQYDIDGGSTIAEAASLCSRGIRVQVLVSRTNYHKLKAMYEAKAGAHQNFMTVTPLLIQDSQLTTERMQRLMSLDETTGNSPLYMDVIMRMLREMALDPSPFSLATFEKLVALERFEPTQRNMLRLRMDLLKSFCASGAQAHRRAALHRADTPGRDIISRHPPIPDRDVFDVQYGVLTIRSLGSSRMVVALDEAHKFLDKSAAASLFTDSLLTVIREQRHKGIRVVVATQEPTISEKFLDLCSMTIDHGFNSSDWFKALKGHLSGASELLTTTAEQAALLKEIIALHQGESLVFSPTSYVHTAVENGKVVPKKLAGGVLRMQTRLRQGDDGGRSIMAVQRI